MKIIDYLRERHPSINSLTSAEAKILHIPYPLQKGWVSDYGKIELPTEIVRKLRIALVKRRNSESYLKNKQRSENRQNSVSENHKTTWNDHINNMNHFKSL
jgi:hypothetical protein